MIFRIFLFTIIALLSVIANAAPTVALVESVGKYQLGLSAEVLEDELGELGFSQVSSKEYKNKWNMSDQEIPNFAISDSVYWLRITFNSTLTENKVWWFEVGYALQDYLDFYVIHEGVVERVINTGDRRPFNTRPVNFRNFLFELDINPGETKQVYLRLDTHDGLHEPCPITLWDKDEFAFELGTRNLGLGLFFGIMIVMGLYNFFIYLSVKDLAYLYYVAYICGFCAWEITYYGFSFQYLWPNSPVFGNQILFILNSFWAMCTVQFVRHFLHTKTLVPWFERASYIYLVGGAAIILFALTGRYAIGNLLIVPLGITYCIPCLVAGVICWRENYRPSRYFLVAWSAFLLSITFFTLKMGGILPATFMFEKSIQIGSVVEVILLSLGLADRINTLKREKLEALKGSNKLKDEFMSTITHELLTPINGIRLSLSLMSENLSEEDKEYLQISKSSSKHMLEIVESMLIFTESRRGTLRLKRKPFNLINSIQHIFNEFGDSNYKQLNFVLNIDSSTPKMIEGDQKKLTLIVTELLRNAVTFTKKGNITLSSSATKASVEGVFDLTISVSDTGSGISDNQKIRIFEAFEQLDNSFTREQGGLGIGLTNTKDLLDLMAGSLQIESSPNQGTTVTIELPVKGIEGEEEGLNQDKRSELPVNGGVKTQTKILIVEDNAVNAMLMAKVLRKAHYCVVVAVHGEDALERLEENPDTAAILMDCQMPVMDGFEATRRIRLIKMFKDIPIIAVTANVSEVDQQRCRDVGMSDYLPKPASKAGIETTLARWVTRH